MKLSYFSYDFWECCCVAPLVFRAPRMLCEAGLLDAPVGGGTTQFRIQFPPDYFKP